MSAPCSENSPQGKLANLKGHIFPHSIDVTYTCPIPPHERFSPKMTPAKLERRLVPQKAIGGAWTEYLHSDADLLRLATAWAGIRHHSSPRMCPFCENGHGTPKHYLMACPETQEHAHAICDAVESELARWNVSQELIAAATEFYGPRATAPIVRRSMDPLKTTSTRGRLEGPRRLRGTEQCGTNPAPGRCLPCPRGAAGPHRTRHRTARRSSFATTFNN